MKQTLTAIISSITTIILIGLLFLMMGKGEAEVVVGTPNETNVGVIDVYSGGSIPSGYLLCDGRAVSRTTYASLFATIGTTYGAGDGSTTFNLPNLSGRTSVGKDSNTFKTLGATGGSINTTLTTSNIPSHTHSIPALSGTAASNGAHTHSIPALSGTAASAGAHTHGWKGIASFTPSGSQYQAALFGSDSAQSYINQGKGPQSAGAHTHTVTTKANTTGSNGAHTHNVTTVANTSGSTGSGTSFTNMQPYLVVNYIIKY